MTTENEELKEMFRKGLESFQEQTPGFELTWRSAANASRQKNLLIWKIAASVIILTTIGLAILFYPSRVGGLSGTMVPISSWQEPTKTLINSDTAVQPDGLTGWTSPTDYLLSKSGNLK